MVIDRSGRWWGLLLGALLTACTVAPGAGRPSPAPSEPPRWRTASPESEGFDPMRLASVLQSVGERGIGAHEIVVVRDRGLILDAVVDPADGSAPHQVGEVTEAVVTTLLGIAIDRGLLTLDDPIGRFLAADATTPAARSTLERVTVRHLATMTSGIGCPTGDDDATLAAMMTSPDLVEFVLGLPTTSAPGAVFRTCRPAAHLLTAVLQGAAGVSALEFARQFLFEPLGISDVRWLADPQGIAHGWADLYLRPADLARIGVMWLDGGIWDGRRVVPESWTDATRTERVISGAAEDYGMGWWLAQSGSPVTVEAHGRGGQLLHLRPDLGLVIVTVGSGLSPSDVVPPIVGALVSPDDRLLTDDLGDAALAIAGSRLREGPVATAASTSTATARSVSGVTWGLDANPIGLTSVRLDLPGHRAEGSVTLAFADGAGDVVGPIGLDGRYRVGLDAQRRSVAMRGAWSAKRTFVLEVDEVTAGRAFTLTLAFDSDASSVAIEGRERGTRDGFVVDGRPTPEPE